jgi:hypothetical protein
MDNKRALAFAIVSEMENPLSHPRLAHVNELCGVYSRFCLILVAIDNSLIVTAGETSNLTPFIL